MTTETSQEPALWRKKAKMLQPVTLTSAQLAEVAAKAIVEALSSDYEFQKVLRHSYVHPNGFRKYVLVKGSRTTSEIRIHGWKPDEGVGRIHDHAWDLFSMVVEGALKDIRYSEVKGGSQLVGVAFPYSHKRRRYVLTPRTLVRTFSPASISVVRVGESYFVPAGQTHATQAIESTHTLVCQGPFVRDSCRVLFDRLPETTHHIDTSQVAAESLRNALRVTARALGLD